MISNEKVINYKFAQPFNIYNICLSFFIWDSFLARYTHFLYIQSLVIIEHMDSFLTNSIKLCESNIWKTKQFQIKKLQTTKKMCNFSGSTIFILVIFSSKILSYTTTHSHVAIEHTEYLYTALWIKYIYMHQNDFK